jgi:hypothetical protein
MSGWWQIAWAASLLAAVMLPLPWNARTALTVTSQVTGAAGSYAAGKHGAVIFFFSLAVLVAVIWLPLLSNEAHQPER